MNDALRSVRQIHSLDGSLLPVLCELSDNVDDLELAQSAFFVQLQESLVRPDCFDGRLCGKSNANGRTQAADDVRCYRARDLQHAGILQCLKVCERLKLFIAPSDCM